MQNDWYLKPNYHSETQSVVHGFDGIKWCNVLPNLHMLFHLISHRDDDYFIVMYGFRSQQIVKVISQNANICILSLYF